MVVAIRMISNTEIQAQTILAERKAALQNHEGSDEPRDLISILCEYPTLLYFGIICAFTDF